MSDKQKETVIDYIDNITVPGLVFDKPANEYWALICLKEGMEFLYRQAKHCDDAVKARVNPKGNLKCYSFGNLPEFQGIPMGLLTCSFHWYAISACNYVRTVGAIACQQNSDNLKPRQYAEKIIPEVLAFRDKVAAHIGWASNNKKDNDAERLVSILPPLVFTNDSFWVGAFDCSLKKNGKVSTSKAKAWSICNVHKELQKRYWKE